MNPLRLRLSNYRSFEELDLELPSGCVAVLGENGAGKSSIVNAVELALFGDRHFGDHLNEQAHERAVLLVELEFEHAGELYRVRRSKKRGSAVKVDFERYTDAEWEPLTRETAATTQTLIEYTIALTRTTFRSSAFLAQGDGAAFTEAQPRDRKAILAEVLGLDIWDTLHEAARFDRASHEGTVQRLTDELERSREALADRPAVEQARDAAKVGAEPLVRRLAADEAWQANLQKELTHARTLDARAIEIAAQLAEAEREHEKLDERVAELEAMKAALATPSEREQAEWHAARLPVLEAELEQATELALARERHRELLFQRNNYLGDASRLNELADDQRSRAKEWEAEAPGTKRCPTCEQLMGAEALRATLAAYRREADANDAKAAALDKQAAAVPVEKAAAAAAGDAREVAEIKGDLSVARRAANELAIIAGHEEQRRILDASLKVTREDFVALGRKVEDLNRRLTEIVLPDTAALEKRLSDVAARIASTRQALDSARQGLAVAEAELARLDEVARVAEVELRPELARVQDKLELVVLCERAYGRDGIPTMIVENAAIPQIELEANRILAELGTSFTVELRTQRELKTGGVAESLDIVVVGPGGVARAYETFSGGERTRLNLALRIALARLLAHRRGAEVRVLVVDEPEFLDEPGVARLAEVLRGLSSDFERVFLISHQPALREAFDEVLTVEKHDGVSTLAGMAEPEQVPV